MSYRQKKVAYAYCVYRTEVGQNNFYDGEMYKRQFETKIFEAKFAKESMLPAVPVISKFPFMAIYSCVDVYAIFHFEPMKCL